MRNVDKFTFTARSKDVVQQIRIQNCKGNNLVETAGLELLVAFCERVMVGVGRGGWAAGRKWAWWVKARTLHN